MEIYITKAVLNKNNLKSVFLAIAKKHSITSSYCNCVLKKAFMLSCEITVPLS